MTQAPNGCVPSSLQAVTGISAEEWVRRLRKYNPKACTGKFGSSYHEYGPALEAEGYTCQRVKPWWDLENKFDAPLHVALRMLHRLYPDKHVLLVVNERGGGTHMVAAHGFMVVDNTSFGPRWWADWLHVWQSSRVYVRDYFAGRLSTPRTCKVRLAYVVEKKLKVLN